MADKNKRKSKEENSSVPIAKVMIISALFSSVYFVFIAIFSIIALKCNLDNTYYIPFGMISGLISGFICGAVTLGTVRHSGFLYGAISGIIQGIICSLVMVLINPSGFGLGIFLLFAVIVISSCIGGIIRVNRKKRIRY